MKVRNKYTASFDGVLPGEVADFPPEKAKRLVEVFKCFEYVEEPKPEPKPEPKEEPKPEAPKRRRRKPAFPKED